MNGGEAVEIDRRVMFGILLVNDWVGNRLPRESKEPSVSPRFEDRAIESSIF